LEHWATHITMSAGGYSRQNERKERTEGKGRTARREGGEGRSSPGGSIKKGKLTREAGRRRYAIASSEGQQGKRLDARVRRSPKEQGRIRIHVKGCTNPDLCISE